VTELSLQRLRKAEVLAPGTAASQFSRALFDRLLTSGMSIMELSG
jgi:hypothetical protein